MMIAKDRVFRTLSQELQMSIHVLRSVVFPLLLGGTALQTGCIQERLYVDPAQQVSGGESSIDLAPTAGILTGDFGPRRGFNGDATELTGTAEPGLRTSTVSITRAEADRGTGMIILWTNGELLNRLQTGTYDFAYDASAFDPPLLIANVCSGVDIMDIDYDAPAARGSLVVTQTQEGRAFDLYTETELLDSAGRPTGAIDVADASFMMGR